MSRTPALFLVAAATFAIIGCRYSSSETPPPMEPDFDRLRSAEAPVTGDGGASPQPADAAPGAAGAKPR